MLTARLRGLPDFVIIGAMKTGSTSLYGFIVQHPAVAPPPSAKTLQYFFRYYKFGESWYRSKFPTNLQKYYFYKKTNQKLITGEASPSYLFFPIVPSRMKKVLPDVKLIVTLRNPVDRAYSHYYHTKRLRGETLSFENAIKMEEERCAGEKEQMIKDPDYLPLHYKEHSYLARGVYVDQLENWFKYYDRRQFLILATEDFRKNSQRTMDYVFDFLGVRPFQVENLSDLNVGDYKPMNEDTRKFLVEYFKRNCSRGIGTFFTPDPSI